MEKMTVFVEGNPEVIGLLLEVLDEIEEYGAKVSTMKLLGDN